MPVSDLARDDPVTASPDDSLQDIARAMRDEKVGSVVVVNGQKPIGIVTDRDLALRTIADGEDPERKTARDVMSDDPCCVDAGAGVFELTEAMRDNAVRRVPVTDGDDLAGIITLDDLSRLFSDEHQNLSSVIEAESPAY